MIISQSIYDANSASNENLVNLMARYESQIVNPVSVQCHSAHNNGSTHTNQSGHWSDSHTDSYSD